ncbi:MAG: YhbD family protein [Coriobacteriia bacterium]|nr:YhbD family protein [Coriobacteriia bacterium]
MDSDLISKKDLLAQTGISYGQLYRWKRKGLIPEEWFVKKSTFTGQETFFPRDKMVARVERILSMKDEDISLDDIADVVTPDLSGVSLSAEEAVQHGVVSEPAARIFAAAHPDVTALRYGELLSAFVVDGLLKTGDVSIDEGAMVLAALEEGLPSFEGREADVIVARKMGVAFVLLVSSSAEMCLESATKVVVRMNLQERTEALGARLK